MLKKICLLFFVIISLMAVPDLFAKQADLAGSWYTSDPGMLKAELEGYIKAADVKKPDPGTIAFIAPHAGYRYSGPIAAYTYKAIKELAPDTVIVIGFSHRRHFPGVAVLTDEYFETPLGKAMVDRNMTDRMTRADKRFLQYPDAFNGENSIEMQIPFVQTVLPNAKIVLLEIGDQSFEYARLIADTLAEILRNEKKYVIVGSTDMSHYLPYGIATRKDADTIKALQSLD
ncbi:MAG TPA: AmmeMemoRadiSam system protein B, partial [Candidatus Omnitrophota bacterium]|nr:AmmeMemoRadiSam system protein B [Candidatus Omnitrophota bacterium]